MSGGAALVWLLLGVPLLGGATLAVAGRAVDRVAPAIGVAVAAAALVLGCVVAFTRPAGSAPLLVGISAGASVDGLSALMVVTVTAVTLAVLVSSVAEFAGTANPARFYGLMLIFAGAMLLTVTATTLVLLLMGWEVMGATSYALIGYWWHEPHRVTAANTAFLTTRAADLGLYVAAGAALAGGVGDLRLADLPGASSPWLHVVTAGVVLAALGKSAQLPFSFWLSRAMEGPSAVSALLHSASMVAAGAYLLLRTHPLLTASGWGEPTVAGVGATTALVLGLVAVAQTDLKQLLAASTCAQIGFMVLAAGAGAVAGGMMQLIAHAAVKSLLFLAAGAWLNALGTKALPALRGAARSYRVVGVTFTVGVVALAGLPPASLWLTKDELLAGVLQRSPALYAVGLAAAVVSAAYSIKAAWYVWRPLSPDAADGYDTERKGTRRVAPVVLAPLVVAAVFAAALGVLAVPAIAQPMKRALGAAAEPSSTWPELAVSAALAVGASGLTWWWGDHRAPLPAPVQTVFTGWLGLERAAHLLLVRPTFALAGALAAFDDQVLDRAVRDIAGSGTALARAASRVDGQGLDQVVTGLAAGARRLGRAARRPQTGQLHTYYAQAAAAFALLALVFVFVR